MAGCLLHVASQQSSTCLDQQQRRILLNFQSLAHQCMYISSSTLLCICLEVAQCHINCQSIWRLGCLMIDLVTDAVEVYQRCIASFPGLPTVQFCSMSIWLPHAVSQLGPGSLNSTCYVKVNLHILVMKLSKCAKTEETRPNRQNCNFIALQAVTSTHAGKV